MGEEGPSTTSIVIGFLIAAVVIAGIFKKNNDCISRGGSPVYNYVIKSVDCKEK